MNNVTIVGKVIEKSSIHFDYMNKLKTYFYLMVMENNNIFKIIVSEKHMGIGNANMIYQSINSCNTICVYGSINKIGNKYYVLCKEMYMIV